MAYDSDYLAGPNFVGGGSGVQEWTLQTVDGLATVTASGYISDASDRKMTAGDIVRVVEMDALPGGNGVSVTGIALMGVSMSAGGVATLVATALD